jgi:hypothetical protein
VTIKETAGKMLLYFYQLQRTAPLTMPYRQIGFVTKKEGGVGMSSDKKWLTKDLLSINPVSNDIFNAFLFLMKKNFIETRERTTAGAKVYVGIHLSELGIDVIEGIERGEEGRQDFTRTFNISVDGVSEVDELIKDTLTNLSEQ